jgi:hypothetical protein
MPFLDDPLVQTQIARWRQVIVKSWQRQVGAIVATGRLLIRAQRSLIDTHGAWAALVDSDGFPFSQATAQKLMAIADHDTLSTYSTWNRLPASWTVLYQLSLIEAPTLRRLITSGDVNRSMTMTQALALRERRERGERETMTEVERITIQTRHTITAAIVRLEQLIDDGAVTRDEMMFVHREFNDAIAMMSGFTADLLQEINAGE